MGVAGCQKNENEGVKASIQSEQTQSGQTDSVIQDIPEKIGGMNTVKVMSDIRKAQSFLKEDGGRLWGQELESRIIVFDDETRQFIASENDEQGSFESLGDMYTGTFPEDVALGNSTTFYGGKSWATVIYTEDIDEITRLGVFVHEMFHNNQPNLGMTFGSGEDAYLLEEELVLQEDSKVIEFIEEAENDESMEEAEDEDFIVEERIVEESIDEENIVEESIVSMDNMHMDTMEARILLKLEWEALYKALVSEGNEKVEAVKAAYAFRKARQDQYESTWGETMFEVGEGLADYTMYKLVYDGYEPIIDSVKKSWDTQLDEVRTPSLVRSFGYHSGFLYGVLLDEVDSEWKKNVKVYTDLGFELKEAYDIDDTVVNIDDIKAKYNYDDILEYESKREEKRLQEVSELKKQYVDGKVIFLPLQIWSMTLNPNRVRSLDGYGVLYYEAVFYENWGILSCEETAGLTTDTGEYIVVPATNIHIDGTLVRGDGWLLTLNEGYQIKETEDGNYMVHFKLHDK